MTTKQNCCCITKSRYKECLDDFNCERCGMCMNWRGYEEGTIDCGCKVFMECNSPPVVLKKPPKIVVEKLKRRRLRIVDKH